MNKFTVFNETDGVYASAEKFDTEKEAEEFIEDYLEIYKKQGYYFTNNMRRIDPKDVELTIKENK